MKSGLTGRLRTLLLAALLALPVFGGEPGTGGGPVLKREAGRLTAEFVDADIRDVVRTLGRLAGINLIISEEVSGSVTISLKDVRFEDAIQAIIEMRGLDYEKVGDIMRVAPFEDIQRRKQLEEEASPLKTEVFTLNYANAVKVEPVIRGFLSDRGSASVYHRSIRGGWPVIGIADEVKALGPAPRESLKSSEFPTMILVRDTAGRIEIIREVIAAMDIRPRQVLIEAVIAEIRYDDKRDIGINWETVTGPGAGEGRTVIGGGREAGLSLGTGDIPSPEAGFTGLGVTYARMTGTRVRAVIRALELQGRATVLSSPRTLVLDGHEATVLVGLKHPIFETIIIRETDAGVRESLSHYEPIGVLLRVVPAIWSEELVNLSVHPAVTALGAEVSGKDITAREIITQEVDTNITIRSGDTVVIGGLIKDDSELRLSGVPVLSHIPVLGFFFRREQAVKTRQELVIFITPTILDDAELTPAEAGGLEKFSEKLEASGRR